MKRWFSVLLWCLALSFFPFEGAALAQGVPRLKATVLSFDGKMLSLKTADPEPMNVALLPDTRIVRQEKRALSDIQAGAYVGATLTVAKDGSRHAQEVHLFPDAMRGNSEGLFGIDGGRFMVDGTVEAAAPNLLTVDYRGATGDNGPACTGRAPRIGGCEGRADIMIAAGVPVTALVMGDRNLLVPGAVLAISLMAGPEGHPVTPGITVEAAPFVETKPDNKAPASSGPPALRGSPGH